ncbi:MAG: hypothetical protein WA919_02210 [Coleofasciculaceae cyanobacterium]
MVLAVGCSLKARKPEEVAAVTDYSRSIYLPLDSNQLLQISGKA